MQKPIAYLVLLFFLVSCSTNPDKNVAKADTTKNAILNPDTLADDDSGLMPMQIVTDSNEMQIISATDTLYFGDTLTINFKVPHFKDLAITTPSDKFYFLIYFHSDADQSSIVDWDEFANHKTLAIITNETKANPWDARIKSNQLIFTETGVYEIRLSENLETDDGTPVEIRKVFYFDKKRQK